MKITVAKRAVELAFRSGVTPFIWGHCGVGKSSLVRQLASSLKMGFIDMRTAQMEAADIRGLPDKDESGRTVYCQPDELPVGDMEWSEIEEAIKTAPDEEKRKTFNNMQKHAKNGILFLDEINRAPTDVLQAVFELVLDRKIGGYTLPDGWVCVAAGNYGEGDYHTNSFVQDAAFVDRFCHLEVSQGEISLDEWVNYMIEKHGENAASIIEFASYNIKHLDGEKSGNLDVRISPSRRSWDLVGKIEHEYKQNPSYYGEAAHTEVLAGIVGRELALSYGRYSCPVKWREVVENGVKKMSKKMAGLQRNQLVGLMYGLVSGIKSKINEEKYAKLAIDFAEWLCENSKEKDIVVSFVRSFLSADPTKNCVESLALLNKNMAKLVQEIRSKEKSKEKTFVDYLTENEKVYNLIINSQWGTDVASA